MSIVLLWYLVGLVGSCIGLIGGYRSGYPVTVSDICVGLLIALLGGVTLVVALILVIDDIFDVIDRCAKLGAVVVFNKEIK